MFRLIRWSQDAEVLSDVLSDGSYKVHVLLATSVIDNGVSIVDQSVSNFVISGFEAIQAIQQVGRIRLQSPEQTVRLFVCRYTAEFFNRKRHSFHMKRNALRILQFGNQERIIEYLLEYYMTELDDNIRRLKEDEDGYIKKFLTWFGLFYNFQEKAVVELRM